MRCMYTIEKHILSFLSNGHVAVTIDFERYLCAFPLQLYNFKVDYFSFHLLVIPQYNHFKLLETQVGLLFHH